MTILNYKDVERFADLLARLKLANDMDSEDD
jgi:hypothetical protein